MNSEYPKKQLETDKVTEDTGDFMDGHAADAQDCKSRPSDLMVRSHP